MQIKASFWSFDVSVLEQLFDDNLSHLLGVDSLGHLAVDQLPGNPSEALTFLS